jgi:hypothetical protein
MNAHSWSNLGFVYTHPDIIFETDESKSLLAGSEHFHVNEIEVYTRQ